MILIYPVPQVVIQDITCCDEPMVKLKINPSSTHKYRTQYWYDRGVTKICWTINSKKHWCAYLMFRHIDDAIAFKLMVDSNDIYQ